MFDEIIYASFFPSNQGRGLKSLHYGLDMRCIPQKTHVLKAWSSTGGAIET
jgi:hypothetical protein